MTKTILVFNVGSSSVKYALFVDDARIIHGNKDRIDTLQKRKAAVKDILQQVNKYTLDCIAHRIVHGGNVKEHAIVTPAIIKKIQEAAKLAPLHDIPELQVIQHCAKQLTTPQAVIFDTVFHSTLDKKAQIYAIPYKFFEQGIRRYGFHGISHEFVSHGLLGKVITCHLGNGCSVSAIHDGVCKDTSMGFTPLEGVVMGTRSGSVDPAIVEYLIKTKKQPLKKVMHVLNHESGLLGLSQESADMRDLLSSSNPKAKLALDVFSYSIAKQIGAFTSTLNGVDTIVFTGGIGENSPLVRNLILYHLTHFGAIVDPHKNEINSTIISAQHSKVLLRVIKTNEELAIARKAKALMGF